MVLRLLVILMIATVILYLFVGVEFRINSQFQFNNMYNIINKSLTSRYKNIAQDHSNLYQKKSWLDNLK